MLLLRNFSLPLFYFVILSLLVSSSVARETAQAAALTLSSTEPVDIELKGYAGLAEKTLFSGSLSPGENKIDIPYSGLALLVFSGGQSFPILLNTKPFTLSIKDPSEPPSFTESEANSYFYDALTGKTRETEPPPDDFAHLMIQGKQLLESTRSTRTMDELRTKNAEFHEFVRDNYDKLKHSDMVMRLIAQYFMMHEYVDYHIEGAPAADIQVQYRQAVLTGVANWLEILQPYIPEHEILNYIVSLYYQRSMVTLAALIVEKYRNIAYCPGVEKETWSFPPDLLVAGVNGSGERELGIITGEKIFAFVSDDCPVSMVEAVVTARRLADRKEGVRLVVIPLERLSETHLAMNRMVSNGNMEFMVDEQWRKEHLAERITLPLFVERSCSGRL